MGAWVWLSPFFISSCSLSLPGYPVSLPGFLAALHRSNSNVQRLSQAPGPTFFFRKYPQHHLPFHSHPQELLFTTHPQLSPSYQTSNTHTLKHANLHSSIMDDYELTDLCFFLWEDSTLDDDDRLEQAETIIQEHCPTAGAEQILRVCRRCDDLVRKSAADKEKVEKRKAAEEAERARNAAGMPLQYLQSRLTRPTLTPVVQQAHRQQSPAKGHLLLSPSTREPQNSGPASSCLLGH